MSGKTIGITMGHGFAGNYARLPDMVVGTLPVAKDSGRILFGEAVFFNSGAEGTSTKDSHTAQDFVGVAVCEVKSAFSYDSMEGGFDPQEAASVLKRGAVTVLCNTGTPAPGGKVYVRIAENSAIPAGRVGGFEADADGANTIELSNAVWSSGKDASNIAELLLKTVNLV